MKNRRTRQFLQFLIPMWLLIFMIQPAVAQEAVDQDTDVTQLEEVVVVGSRVPTRSAHDSPVPIDVIEGNLMRTYGARDMDSLLAATVPSFNVNRQPISDAATLVRPANMRGLSPDNLLILVNGKRRHRASVITFLAGGIADGSHAPDLAAIPAVALKRVEVLRDGAAAQYGSDAIAGVMNFMLNDAPDSGRVETRWGQFYEGDGDAFNIAGNLGVPLPLPFVQSGFANFSFEYGNSDPTDRSIQRADAQGLINAGNTDVRQPHAQVWGAPEYHYDYKLFGNLGLDLNSSTELYAFGNYAQRKVEGGFFFRNPNTRPGVFRGPRRVRNFRDSVQNRDDYYDTRPDGTYDGTFDNYLKENRPPDFEDLDNDEQKKIDEALIKVVEDDRYPTLKVINLDPSQGGCPIIDIDDAADYTDVTLPDNCALFNSRFAGGFTPTFGGTVRDWSAAVGIRGDVSHANFWLDDWHYDLSAVFGHHSTDFFMTNTINPQLIAKPEYNVSNIPTNYNPGIYTERDHVLNLDLSRAFDTNAFASPLNVGLGMEYRVEEFEVQAGGENSWFVDKNPGGLAAQGFGVASNGFPGFPDISAGTNNRGSYAAYLDLETNLTKNLLTGVAARFEEYETFGDTLNGKVDARWQATSIMALRGSLSTGFRAPTVGQANIRNVTTEFTDGQLSNTGTLPPSLLVGTSIKGVKELQPEKSVNLSAGTVLDLGNLSVTVDYYRIQIQDRITQSGKQPVSDADREILATRGLHDVDRVAFFTNEFDTTTQGIDIVATYPLRVSEGTTLLTLAGNWNQTEVTRYNPDVLDPANAEGERSGKRLIQLEQNLPNFRFTLTADHRQGPWRFLSRLHYYDDFVEFTANADDWRVDAAERILIDLEGSYTFKLGVTVAAGAQNLFDAYPSRASQGAQDGVGALYPESSPYGFNGGFYYFRALYAF